MCGLFPSADVVLSSCRNVSKRSLFEVKNDNVVAPIDVVDVIVVVVVVDIVVAVLLLM